MARPMHIIFKRLDLKKSIQEVIDISSQRLKSRNVKISFQVKKQLPEIVAWADGLKQVFINLINNAVEAMPDGGEIVVKASPRAHTVHITFEDTGPGIKEEHIPHIFESFFTTRENSAGTGLGLSVCFGIIKNHNGIIDFYNTEKGGCFRIKLPIEQEEAEHEWQI